MKIWQSVINQLYRQLYINNWYSAARNFINQEFHPNSKVGVQMDNSSVCALPVGLNKQIFGKCNKGHALTLL